MLSRVSVSCALSTFCPNLKGGRDENVVTVTWAPARRVDAEDIHALVSRFTDSQMYCEDLAEEIAGAFGEDYGEPVTVVVRQVRGHGVEAEARWP